MKNILLLIISFFLFSHISFACMPFTPNQIVIWTFEWTETKNHPNWESLDFINISNTKKPLAENYTKIGKYFFIAHDNEYWLWEYNLDDDYPNWCIENDNKRYCIEYYEKLKELKK